MSELPAGLEPALEVVPRESASTIVLRPGPDGREVLLGVRSRRSRFMPGHWAFPGGVLESADEGDYARCAARELEEETGLAIDPATLAPAGARTTPPMFPVRFRTEFFVGEVASETPTPEPPNEEIERLLFSRPEAVLARWSAGECAVPPPVLPLLRALVDRIDQPLEEIVGALESVNGLEQRASRIEFTPGIWMIPLRTRTMPPATTTNVWMPGGKRFAIIDPGSTEADEQARLLEVVERRRGVGHEPVAVLLTHEHQDHISGVTALCDALDLPLRAHPLVLEDARVSTVSRREPLQDGDEIDLEGVTLRAHHTPGHSAGHLAFEVPELGGLIAGDLLSGISTILVDPHAGSMSDYLRSLERMHALGLRTLFPGHGPPLPGKAFAKLIAHRRDRERLVLEQVGESETPIGAIARAAYQAVPQLPQALIELQTLAHLIDLERRGRVRRSGDERNWERA